MPSGRQCQVEHGPEAAISGHSHAPASAVDRRFRVAEAPSPNTAQCPAEAVAQRLAPQGADQEAFEAFEKDA